MKAFWHLTSDLTFQSCLYRSWTRHFQGCSSCLLQHQIIVPRAVGLNYLLQTGLALLLKRLLRLSGSLSHSAREYLGGVMVLPCLLALLALPSPALALAAFLASLLPAALLGTSLGQQVGLLFSLLASISVVSLSPSSPEYCEYAGSATSPVDRLALH